MITVSTGTGRKLDINTPKSITAAKRMATKAATFNHGTLTVRDTETKECWVKEYWQRNANYGWLPWSEEEFL